MDIAKPYLLFLGDVHDQLAAKTAQGIVDWRPEWCIGQFRLPGCKADTGLPDVSIADAAAKGAKTMVVGVANAGGVLPDHWIREIVAALDAGLDVATGLHKRLGSIPEIAAAAARHGRRLHDVRFSDIAFATGKGTKRPGRRLLTVGTDCSVGKKYTALAMEREMRRLGMNAEFRATGQTGYSFRDAASPSMPWSRISSRSCGVDPPANELDHWDVIEGQGSLFHPSFSGVTLGLLHGAQPDAFIVCHETDTQDHAGRPASAPEHRAGHRTHDDRGTTHQPGHHLHRHRYQYRAPLRARCDRLSRGNGQGAWPALRRSDPHRCHAAGSRNSVAVSEPDAMRMTVSAESCPSPESFTISRGSKTEPMSWL